MKAKLESNPAVLVAVVLIGAYIFFNNQLESLVWIGIFVGAAGFANSLWLSQRINTMESSSHKKQHTLSQDEE